MNHHTLKTTRCLRGEGRIYEVDILIPQRLHDHHSDYPLAPEKIEIGDDIISDFSR